MMGDTIAAVSTPRGKGGVALIRVSGPEAIAIASQVFKPASGKLLQDCPSRTQIFGSIYAPDETADTGWAAVDTGLACLFKAPSSFTGENIVEICCHGGILLTETILASVLVAGARPADPGEFTRRAFVNGKMGLDAAEALGNLLEATSREQLRLSHAGMSGRLSKAIRQQYDILCHIMSSVYAAIDYPDEDLAEMSPSEMLRQIQDVGQGISTLLNTYSTGHAIAEGIPTILCGSVNSGKSALYNRLVGKDAAIVTEIAGTTRDLLETTVPVGRVTLRLVDTAGLRQTNDVVEKIGIDKAKKSLEESELILFLMDGSRPITDEDMECVRIIKEQKEARNCPIIFILSKADLEKKMNYASLRDDLGDPIFLSAQTGMGIEELVNRIEQLFIDGRLNTNEDAIVANARQHSALLRASDALNQAIQALQMGLPLDLVSESIEITMRELCQVDGRQVSDDVVTGIFSHFCVGK